MHSLWPFGRDESSPASFEKALSRLSAQISSSTVSLDKARGRAHRSKSFWTLWSTLAYLIYTSILVLVLGPQQWSVPHYAGLAGAPVLIYGVRRIVAVFFEWQVSRQQGHLSRLTKERDQKIGQLKKATKYDTTQELLNKYGGSVKPDSDAGDKQGPRKKKKQGAALPSSVSGQRQQFQRTGLSPPPTANIPGRSSPASHTTSGRPPMPGTEGLVSSTPPPYSRGAARSPRTSSMSYPSPHIDLAPDEPGFAPNAFPDPPVPQTSSPSTYNLDPQTRWYDRILDVMLGEDETLAKNRLVLICDNCRLVNGQAPPGVRTVEGIGRWRCGSCGSWNGSEKEAERAMGRMMREVKMQEQQQQQHRQQQGEVNNVARDYHPESPGSADLDEEDEEETEAANVAAGKSSVGSRSPGSLATREVPDSAEDDSEESLDDQSQGGEEGVDKEEEKDSVATRVKSKRQRTKRSLK